MLFNTVNFFIFLAVTLTLFYASPRALRNYILLAASYFFYGTWNVKFLALLLTLTVIDYVAGIWIEQTPKGHRRKIILIGSLCANLGFLGFFKYFNFLASNVALLMHRPANSFAMDIVLPLGISFHTFQSMSYVIDVYRSQQKAVRNPIHYALFICFFPQLVAGPIVRARDFFRDLWNWNPPSAEEVSRGIFLITLGLTKKMAFADQFAKIANTYFADVAGHPGMYAAWSGVGAFALQIYFDFSGYTDMAIGMAKLLGFHFPINFRRPYLAWSVTEFWRRWHISLSSWLRDYLYISLGGNRHGRWMTYRNLMITMLLGGLWHGASWNFLIWGGYQGALLSIERALGIGEKGTHPLLYPFRALLTFFLACIGWVFFRAADLTQSMQVLRQMFSRVHGESLLQPWHFGLAAAWLIATLMEEHWHPREDFLPRPGLAYAAAMTALLVCLDIFAVTDAAIPFIYFQF